MSDNGHTQPLTDGQKAYWLFMQLYGHRPQNADWFINFRVLHNQRPKTNIATGQIEEHTEPLFQQNIPVKSFAEQWLAPGGLYARFAAMNQDPEKPGNIYYGVNPRTHPTANKKSDCAGYIAFYLDLDVNKKYTLEMRQKQLDFWIACGLTPTFILASGNGYHVYWVFKTLVPSELGQPVLKRMVQLTGCKDGGNVHDVSRILRLPGFDNVKKWYSGERPPCAIVYPNAQIIQDSYHAQDLIFRYDLETFEYFPPSEIEVIETLEAQAVAMGGEYGSNLVNLARQYKLQCREQQIGSAAKATAQQSMLGAAAVQQQAQKSEWQPTLTTIPPDIDEVPFPRKHAAWMKMYCRKGFDGLTPQEHDKIKAKVENPAASASELDYMIIYHLVKRGYTFEAITEFWHRPSLLLLRADKESRSPNYLNISFENAVKAVRETMTTPMTPEEQIQKATVVGNIQIKGYKVFIMKGDSAERIMHGEPIIRKVFEDKEAMIPSDREYFEMEFRAEDFTSEKGYKSSVQIIPRKAFHSVSEFKKYLHGDIVLLTDRNGNLAQLLNHLIITYANVPRVEFHSRVTYKENKFVFPYLTIHKDRFELTQKFDFVPELVQRFPWHESFVDQVVTPGDLRLLVRETWPHVLKVHMPQLILSMIGTIAASAMRTILLHDELTPAINIPTINVRGGSTRGKSLTVKLLYKLIGLKNDDPVVSTESSKFALLRAIGISNFVPFVLDEFKLEKNTEDAVAHVRALVRRSYTGETVLRGQANLGLSKFKVTGSIVVVGETQLERTGDISEISRVLPIITDDWDTAKSAAHFLALQNSNLSAYGPYLLQFLLNLDRKATLARLEALYLEHIEKIGDVFGREKARIAQNLAVIQWGCELFDQFLQSLDYRLPTLLKTYDFKETMVEYLKRWCESSGQSLTYTNEAEPEKKQIVSRDELFDFLGTLSLMIQGQDEAFQKENEKNIYYYMRSEERSELLLDINLVYNAYVLHCRKLGKFPTDRDKIRSLLQSAKNTQQPWLIKYRHVARKRPDSSRGYMVFNLKMLREMQVWHPAEAEPENVFVQNHEQGSPSLKPPPEPAPNSPSQNRISDLFSN